MGYRAVGAPEEKFRIRAYIVRQVACKGEGEEGNLGALIARIGYWVTFYPIVKGSSGLIPYTLNPTVLAPAEGLGFRGCHT